MYGKDEQEALGQDGHVDGDAFVGWHRSRGHRFNYSTASRSRILRRFVRAKKAITKANCNKEWMRRGYQPDIRTAARQAGAAIMGIDPMSMAGNEEILAGPKVQASSTLGSAYRRGMMGDAFVGGRSGQGFLTASPRGFASSASPEWFQSHPEAYLSESGGRGGRFLSASPRGFMSAQSPDWFQSHPEEYLSESGGDAFVGKVSDALGAICGNDAYKRGC